MRIEEIHKDHRWKPGVAVLIWLTFFFLIANIVLAYLPQLDTSLFDNDIGALSDRYSLDISPTSWTFTIWLVIFVSQLIMLFYMLSLTCRRNELSRGQLYYDPPFLPATFYAIYILACILNVAWLFTWDEELLVASMAVLIALTVALYLCIFFAVKLLYQYEPELSRKELWLNVVLVHNVLGMYAAWTTVAASLNVGIVLRYTGDYSMELSCWTSLITVAALLFVHFLVDISILTVRYRYFYTPYFVVLFAAVGIVYENLDWDVNYQIMAVAIVGASVLMILTKIIFTIVRCVREPTPLEIDD